MSKDTLKESAIRNWKSHWSWPKLAGLNWPSKAGIKCFFFSYIWQM